VTAHRPIRRLLIANRGEIAVRIARGARELGIVPLGVYSDADAGAFHLDAMDDAVRIGPAPAPESYLDAQRIIAAAQTLRADALHPGYGFLSERAPFARAVADAGIIFVGPPPAAIEAMGDKIEGKRRVRERGVPVVPGYDGDDQSDERLHAEARLIGAPLLIKASAGGGGRGMRVVQDVAAFREALDAARREALTAFGDDHVLLERYLGRPRHVEFQILGDAYGHTIHLGERESSIQRRHQKVVEEAPSTALDARLRAEMGSSAVRAAESVGYTNAGTVEFLLDEDGKFYFLEMNARLQVEHPVTEMVHGIDLVRWQLRIAAGEPLTVAQEDVPTHGWAIEARLTAEDPATGYLPASGTITRWEPPAGDGIRVDAGVRSGSEISIYYDSMIAKLIAWGADREAAADRLTAALGDLRIEGIPTNAPLLSAIARDDAFRAGDTTTAFLAERGELLEASAEPDGALVLAIGAALADRRTWRIGEVGVPVDLRGAIRRVRTIASRVGDDGRWRLEGDLAGDVVFSFDAGRVVAVRDGLRIAGRTALEGDAIRVEYDGGTFWFAPVAPPRLGGSSGAKGGHKKGSVSAPMPGKIVKVVVGEGDTVAERDLLVILEAMKMEHRIEAPHAGVVRNVAIAPGALVTGGAQLLEIG